MGFNSSSLFWECAEYAGELLVIAGCVGEYLAEFKEIPRDASARKRFQKRSLIILIAGLATGLFGLFKTTQLSGLEIARLNERAARAELARAELEAKIKQAEITMLSKTPGKMRVVTASAVAVIQLETYFVRTNKPSPFTAVLRFNGTNGTVVKRPILDMVSNEGEESWPWAYVDRTIPLHFEWKQGSAWNELSAPDEPAEELINELPFFSLQPWLLLHSTKMPKILGGSVTLVLNGAVSKTFPIPPQTLFHSRTNTLTGQLENHLVIDNLSTSEAVIELKPH